MKKFKLFALLAVAALTFGCSEDDNSNNNDQTCEDSVIATAAAAQTFAAATDATYTDACNGYKDALQNQISSCGDSSGALQDLIDDLEDCTITEIPVSGVISVTVGGQRTFETNISVTQNAGSRTIYAEDGNTGYWIKITVNNDSTGTAAISDFVLHLGTSDYVPLAVSEGGNFSSNVTVNSQSKVTGTFYGYVTSPTTGADLDLTSGVIDITL